MPKVEVKDAAGKVLRTYDIFADGYGTLVTDENLFDIAKWNAVEDKLASEDQAGGLTFKVVK